MHALTPNLGRSAKSVAVKRYSAQMKSTGTFGDEALQGGLIIALRTPSATAASELFLPVTPFWVLRLALFEIPPGKSFTPTGGTRAPHRGRRHPAPREIGFPISGEAESFPLIKKWNFHPSFSGEAASLPLQLKEKASVLIDRLPSLLPDDPALAVVIAEAMAAEFNPDGRARTPSALQNGEATNADDCRTHGTPETRPLSKQLSELGYKDKAEGRGLNQYLTEKECQKVSSI